MEGFARRLVFKQRHKVTIYYFETETTFFYSQLTQPSQTDDIKHSSVGGETLGEPLQ